MSKHRSAWHVAALNNRSPTSSCDCSVEKNPMPHGARTTVRLNSTSVSCSSPSCVKIVPSYCCIHSRRNRSCDSDCCCSKTRVSTSPSCSSGLTGYTYQNRCNNSRRPLIYRKMERVRCVMVPMSRIIDGDLCTHAKTLKLLVYHRTSLPRKTTRSGTHAAPRCLTLTQALQAEAHHNRQGVDWLVRPTSSAFRSHTQEADTVVAVGTAHPPELHLSFYS